MGPCRPFVARDLAQRLHNQTNRVSVANCGWHIVVSIERYRCTPKDLKGRLGSEAILTRRSLTPSVTATVVQPLSVREPGVFLFGLDQDRDVGIGVFPEFQEVLIGGAGFGHVIGNHIGAGETESGHGVKDI
jgi:hypothetical protein